MIVGLPMFQGSSRAQLHLRQILDAPEMRRSYARKWYLRSRAHRAFDANEIYRLMSESTLIS